MNFYRFFKILSWTLFCFVQDRLLWKMSWNLHWRLGPERTKKMLFFKFSLMFSELNMMVHNFLTFFQFSVIQECAKWLINFLKSSKKEQSFLEWSLGEGFIKRQNEIILNPTHIRKWSKTFHQLIVTNFITWHESRRLKMI